MTVKWVGLLWFSLVAVIAAGESQTPTDCAVFEPHITLGDAFRVDPALPHTHLFTVGLTVSPRCASLPVLLLRGPSLSDRSKPHFLRKDIAVPIGDAMYERSGLFFAIDAADVADGYRTWEVRLDGRLWHSVETIPTRLLSPADDLRLFVIADFDNTETAEPTWQKLAQIDPQQYDMVVHVGDFAYEIWSDQGRRGDQYFARSSQHTRRVPFVMTPGNHENFANGSLLNYRFRMPNAADPTNAMFDFVAKGVYFMFVNLDWVFRFEPWVDLEYRSRERAVLEWMEARHRLVSERTDIKWRVFSSHRPFECSSSQIDRDCTVNHYFFRRIADMAAKLGFQFSLNAHLHSYVRHKLYHGLEPQPLSKIGKGVLFTVISGHSGTEYFFHNESFIQVASGPYVEKIDVSGPTFLNLEFDDKLISGKLIRADNNQVCDQFSVMGDRTSQDPQNKVTYTVIIITLAGMLLVTLGLYLSRQKLTKKSSGGYMDPSTQVGTSMVDANTSAEQPSFA